MKLHPFERDFRKAKTDWLELGKSNALKELQSLLRHGKMEAAAVILRLYKGRDAQWRQVHSEYLSYVEQSGRHDLIFDAMPGDGDYVYIDGANIRTFAHLLNHRRIRIKCLLASTPQRFGDVYYVKLDSFDRAVTGNEVTLKRDMSISTTADENHLKHGDKVWIWGVLDISDMEVRFHDSFKIQVEHWELLGIDD